MPIDTIDSIKRRMIRNASKIWGYTDVQDINSFDPVLGLIIGALAEELHNISLEIDNSDTRVIEKMLELLFSRNTFTHFPAHAVACAKPLQPRVTINDFYQFYFTKEIHGPTGREGTSVEKSIFFTPTADCTLLNGEVKYMFAGKYLYEIDGRLKEIVAETARRVGDGNSRLFFGIRLDPLIEILDGLSLFFSFKNIQSEDRFYNALHTAKWKINGNDVIFRNGMEAGYNGTDNSLLTLIKKENNISYRTVSFINDFYNKSFMTLAHHNYRQKDLIREDTRSHVLYDYFKDKRTDIFNQDIFWVEIDLAQPFSVEEINNLVVSLNCFPVINRELNEYTHSIVKGTNVVPLLTDDLFFDIKRVSDSRDVLYTPRNSFDEDNEGDNTYLIRQGGVARFDSRDAGESIKHLIDLVRDEAAAFAINGADLISFELKQLDQILTRLHQRIDISGVGDDLNSYLILESDNEYDKINVQFWSIAGDIANNIRPGSALSVYRGVDLEDKSVVLQIQTVGGRQKLSREDKLNTLRRSLLSKGRIVTAEDIKVLCFELFGSDLISVEVKKGVSIANSPGRGMTRTLDIYLYFKEGIEFIPDDLKHKTESLKIMLKRDSINLLPYRVFVK